MSKSDVVDEFSNVKEGGVIIGLETHVQINTKTKMFCSCPSMGDDVPNTRTCPTCIGAPGSKPSLNEAVVNKAISVALALNCSITKNMVWDRKNYFYPDMGKNYQITQHDTPIGVNGFIEVNNKKIRIRRIHMEEDPAKLIHVGGSILKADYVLVDYNRSGIPLLEIVTEPDLSSPEEARDYLNLLLSILEHVGVYEINDFTLKTDANISLKGSERVEVKNISGFKAVETALRYEVTRQKNLLKMNQKVVRDTRHFEPVGGTTQSLRTKESEMDYGYIVDPDLPLITLNEKNITKVRDALPELPAGRIKRFMKEYKMNVEQARTLVGDKALADFFESCVKDYKTPAFVAGWIDTQLLKCLNYNKQTIRESKVTPESFMELIKLIDSNVITERYAKELIKEFVTSGKSPKKLVESKGVTVKDDSELKKLVSKVLKDNPMEINDKSINFLIGQVLKASKGQADPNKVRELLRKN